MYFDRDARNIWATCGAFSLSCQTFYKFSRANFCTKSYDCDLFEYERQKEV